MKTVDAVLFAAGLGERMQPLTSMLPKPAVPLLDVPLGAWGLAALREVGGSVVVNVSHLGDRVVGALAPHGAFDVLDEGAEPYGTAGTLYALRDRLAETFVTYNSDSLVDLSPADVAATHRSAGAPATVVTTSVDRGADFVVEGGRAVQFLDRRRSPDRPGARFAGIGVWSKEVLELIPGDAPAGLGATVLEPLAESGRLAIHPAPGAVLDVGSIGAYLDAGRLLLGGGGPPPPVPPPGAIVDVEGGRAYVSVAATVEEGSLGPGAIVLDGAIVGSGAHVEGAVVWPDEEVPSGTRVEDCVWAFGVPHPPN